MVLYTKFMNKNIIDVLKKSEMISYKIDQKDRDGLIWRKDKRLGVSTHLYTL